MISENELFTIIQENDIPFSNVISSEEIMV